MKLRLNLTDEEEADMEEMENGEKEGVAKSINSFLLPGGEMFH